LTRHQNHHTGTVEESEVATAAVLASRGPLQNQRSRGSDEEDYSADGKSPMPPSDRPSSMSPAVGMNGMPQLQRQASDYYLQAMSNGGMAPTLPAHLRNEMNPTPRSQSPAQYAMPVSQQQRPALTSNPSSGYNPPQILEPSANVAQQTGSGNNSPHMSALNGGWSPQSGMATHTPHDYAYPDPNHGYSNVNHLYYQQQGVQRPHSTGPMDNQYQMRGPEMWAQHQQ